MITPAAMVKSKISSRPMPPTGMVNPLPAALYDSLIMTKTMAKKRDAIVAAVLGSVLMLNADCPKRDARLQDRCDLVCRDLPKVL
jgi:hypothetical protein